MLRMFSLTLAGTSAALLTAVLVTPAADRHRWQHRCGRSRHLHRVVF